MKYKRCWKLVDYTGDTSTFDTPAQMSHSNISHQRSFMKLAGFVFINWFCQAGLSAATAASKKVWRRVVCMKVDESRNETKRNEQILSRLLFLYVRYSNRIEVWFLLNVRTLNKLRALRLTPTTADRLLLPIIIASLKPADNALSRGPLFEYSPFSDRRSRSV